MNVIEILSEDIAITYLCFAAMDDHTDEAMVETHFEKRKPRQKRAIFAIFSLFLKHMLISMQFIVISALGNWYGMGFFDFYLHLTSIDRYVVDFHILIYLHWKITFCWKNILSDIFFGGYPVWKCELWLDLSNKTQKHNFASCHHELFI